MLANSNQSSKPLSRAQQRRREDIIEAALEIFERDGFEAAKMADIAQKADVAKGTLYLYFDTKDDLLEGVIMTSILPTLQEIGIAAQSHEGSAKTTLAQQIKIATTRMASPEMAILLRLMISGGSTHRNVIQFYYESVVQQGLKHFQTTLDRGVASGEFREKANSIDVLVLVGAPVYTAIWNILFEDKEPIDPEKLAEDLLDVVLNGLLK